MQVPLLDALSKITLQPAKVLGLDVGHLSLGHAADVCIFDAGQAWKIEPKALKSQGKNTPFLGMELQGKVSYTLVDGHVVYENSH